MTVRYSSSVVSNVSAMSVDGHSPARQPSVTTIDARTSRIVAYGRRSARIPGISPGRRRLSEGRRRAAFGSAGMPPRSSFGARLRRRVPQ